MLARYYEAGLGWFMSADPLPIPDSTQFEDLEGRRVGESEHANESSPESVDTRAAQELRASCGPLKDAQTWNRYAYVGNNPMVRFDPNGLDWIYSQSTGQMSHLDNATGKTTPEATGYAGAGAGLNNPAKQDVQDVGPIPQGTYTIEKQQLNTTSAGKQLPDSMRLTPAASNKMFSRSGFLIHGDNSKGNKSASNGCIVLEKKSRDKIGSSNDKVLKVVK